MDFLLMRGGRGTENVLIMTGEFMKEVGVRMSGTVRELLHQKRERRFKDSSLMGSFMEL